ncbi:class I SAM-dependent methyltransferase [Ktedonosporobacter rubrisoli]|uniref:Class I SAM-dependent methyltransferase n=1 Tax=Ktedonosporobacter rubrisoli TaxID=2509675 RepID=A0A4P6JMZ9_KTERU|nr:class I SAM-dependent methyltransferase [Ktedonosporobacter rubrisoli]QBD76645.1 class I SAM-dependent methyltransferase [Ktedonosporobacter rubrisoli]
MEYKHASYIMDAENVAEMARLIKQARQVTEATDLLPAGIKQEDLHRILDICCGPGEWALEMGKLQPSVQIEGIDISQIMVNYAQMCAQEQKRSNVHFRVMDVHELPLDFPAGSFDLIHARFLVALMKTSDWPALFAECLRLLRPGGSICCVETDDMGSSNSPSLYQHQLLGAQAMRQAGYGFPGEGISLGLIAALPDLLAKAGFKEVGQESFEVDCSAGTPAHKPTCENWTTLLKLSDPFISSQGIATKEELAVLYARIMEEIYSDSFSCQVRLHRLWAQKTF